MPPVVPPPLPPHAQRGSVAATLQGLPLGARPSEVWRSAAVVLLRLNPKECEALALVFEDESATDERRGHVLDLLAGAGTFEAQVVLRRLLALAVARRCNRTFAMFVQRLGRLECPDGPSLRFLMSVYAESRGEPHDVRAACAYALGAAAGQSFASGDVDASVRASDVLRRDLLSATVTAEKCALLTALGNAGVPSDVMVVTRFTQDPDALVRAASALALRKMNVAEAHSRLVMLLADRDSVVAQSALVALAEQKLDDDELERLAELVLSGRTALAIDVRVLHLIVAQRPRLTSCPGRAGAIENALRLLLGRVEANDGSGSGERRLALPPQGPLPPVIDRSGSVRAMPAARPHPSSIPPAMPAQDLHKTVGMLSPLAALTPSLASTILDPPLQARIARTRAASAPAADSGSYRIVHPGDSLGAVRDRMLRMGLDPDARVSPIPQPPPRRAASAANGEPAAAPQPRTNATRLGPFTGEPTR